MMALIVSLSVFGQISSYEDAEGTTHYVDSPSQIPVKYRKKAKPLEATLSTVQSRVLSKEEQAAADAAKRDRQRKEDEAAAAASRSRAVTPSTRSPQETAQQRERKKYDESPMSMRCYGGPDKCIVRPGGDNRGLKSGESCHASGSSCTVPPECCSHKCNSSTFLCD